MSSSKVYDSYWTEGGHVTKEWPNDFFFNTYGPILEKGSVLDYGCGMGYSYQNLLMRAVAGYVGADISKVAVDNTRKKNAEAVEIQEDGTVPLPDGSFESAVCSEVFEHLWDPLASAKELHRVLKPGGMLIATVPNFGYIPWRLMAFLRAEVPSEPESSSNRYRGVHIRFFNTKSFVRMMRDAGFSEVSVHGWCRSSIWDVFWCAGPYSRISYWAHDHLPRFLHLPFLSRLFPSWFGQRLRVVAIK